MKKMIYCTWKKEERDIKEVLSNLAAKWAQRGITYNQITEAVEYIKELENRLKPYEEMEEHLFHRIQEIDDRDKKEKEEKKEEEIKVDPNSHYNENPLPKKEHNGTCCICGRAQMCEDLAHMVDRCTYCGQPYRNY